MVLNALSKIPLPMSCSIRNLYAKLSTTALLNRRNLLISPNVKVVIVHVRYQASIYNTIWNFIVKNYERASILHVFTEYISILSGKVINYKLTDHMTLWQMH